jgi:outer membrane protein insertion porin family
VTATTNCVTNGEAPLAVKALAQQGAKVVSALGYEFTYSTLDRPRDPTQGFFADFKQDVAGLGFNDRFVRTTGDLRYYHPMPYFDDIIGLLRLQGGDEFGYGGNQLSVVDNFNLGPQLVRGFAPGGIGPRDVSDPYNIAANSLGGTKYVGGTAELDFPIWGAPKELGLRGGVFFDAGTLFGYEGQTDFRYLFPNLPAGTPCSYYVTGTSTTQGSCITVDDSKKIRASTGVSLIWASPIGPIRFDYSFVLSKATNDVTQAFSFSGGTSF